MTAKPITVLLVDDHVMVREGLRFLIEIHGDIRVVGQVGTGRQAVALAKKLTPDLVVMDIAMPLLNGIEATRQILQSVPKTKILILSAHSDDEYIKRAVAIGAAGYLIKQTSAEILVGAIREIHKGAKIFSPTVSRRLHAGLHESGNKSHDLANGIPRLTSRETEVVQLIAEGKANKQVAQELGISIKTVEKHRQNLMNKLGIHDTAGLTRFAIDQRIIEGKSLR
jgi:DNA-binding NarL/FixJ family response regulator